MFPRPRVTPSLTPPSLPPRIDPPRAPLPPPSRAHPSPHQVEKKDDGARWRGDFTARYVEDITTKTGSFKKYAVFAKMLVSACVEDSESVFVDLLTYADLEALKAKRQGAKPPAAPVGGDARPGRGGDKRYLILTYAAAFDRVHYPLPLRREEAPSADALQATVARLKRENALLAAGQAVEGGAMTGAGEAARLIGEENARLREENERLKLESRRLARELRAARELPRPHGGRRSSGHASEDDADVSALDVTAPLRARGAKNAKAHAASEREAGLKEELRLLANELRVARRERDEADRATQAAQTEAGNAEASKRRMLQRKQRELDAALAETQARRETERELRVKIKNIATQRDGLEKRLRALSDRGADAAAFPRSSRADAGPGSRPGSRARRPPRGCTTLARGLPRRVAEDGRRVRGTSFGSRAPPPPRGYDAGGSARPRTGRRPRPRAGGARRRGARARRRPGVGSTRRRTSARRRLATRRGSAHPRAGSRAARRRRGRAPGPRTGAAGPRGEAAARAPRGIARRRRGTRGRRAGPGGGRREAPRRRRRRRRRRTGASPGRILRDVKQRLNDFAAKENEGEEGGRARGAASGAKAAPLAERRGGGGGNAAGNSNRREDGGGGGVSTKAADARAASTPPSASRAEASAEIADIDSRLAALQNFLKEAKAGGSPAAGGTAREAEA